MYIWNLICIYTYMCIYVHVYVSSFVSSFRIHRSFVFFSCLLLLPEFTALDRNGQSGYSWFCNLKGKVFSPSPFLCLLFSKLRKHPSVHISVRKKLKHHWVLRTFWHEMKLPQTSLSSTCFCVLTRLFHWPQLCKWMRNELSLKDRFFILRRPGWASKLQPQRHNSHCTQYKQDPRVMQCRLPHAAVLSWSHRMSWNK